MTSTQLWHLIQGEYDGKYKTFTSLLVRYQRYGYIEKYGHKPFTYKLTPWGVENQKNPYMCRDEQKRKYKQFQIDTVGKFINENPDYLKQFVGNGVSYVGSDGGVRVIENNEFVDNHANDDKISELESKVKELEEELKEEREITEHLSNQNKPTMVINQTPQQPQQEPEPEPQKTTNERNYDYILWEFLNKRMTYKAYRKLPKQVLRVVAFPKSKLTDEIKRILRGADGGYIVVASGTAPTLIKLGFAEAISIQDIESLTLIFENGYVYLVAGNARFEICEVPKSARPPQQTQNKPVSKPKQRVSIKVK
jgi:hypothetical protein